MVLMAAADRYRSVPRLRAASLLHALLVALHASLQLKSVAAAVTLSYEESDFALLQTRTQVLSETQLIESSWQVWGVATVLLGGENQNQFYLFDCYHRDGLSVTWSRIDSDVEVNNTPLTGGTRITMSNQISNYLGLYACTTADGWMESLNVTNEVPGLIPAERTVEAISGDSVNLTAYISTANGQVRLVQWKSPSGETVLEYPDPGAEVEVEPSHLEIRDVTPAHFGTYNVTVQSSELFVTHIGHTLIDLEVLVPSNIIVLPLAKVWTDEWENVRLNCSASGSAPLFLTWSRVGSDSASLPVNSQSHVSEEDNGNGIVMVMTILTISDIRYNDRGSYRCTAFNSLTRVNHTATADSLLHVNPVIRIESPSLKGPNLIQASLGTSLSINCFGSGNLSWNTSDGEGVVNTTTDPNTPLFITSDTSLNVLTLSIANFLEEARYTCISDLAPDLRKTVLITNEAVLSVFIADELILALSDTTVSIQTYIHSIAEIDSILWYRNGIQLDPESDEGLTAEVLEGTIATLEIGSFGDEDVGRYVVMVNSSDGSTANASVELAYAVLASAEVFPQQQVVEVGDSVEVNCTADGSGTLTVVWTLEDGTVVVRGNRLAIETVSLFHSGTYVCSVSSPFSDTQAFFKLTVLERLVTLIEYNDIISVDHEVTFRHGDSNPPSFRCLVNGSDSDVSFTWQLCKGQALQDVTSVDTTTHTLSWSHGLDYTDSGIYQCVVREPDTGRESIASVTMTVLHDPVLDTIFPAPSITTGLSPLDYNVPLGFSGPALTCTAFAWPNPPQLRWTKSSGSLPRGVVTNTTTEGGVAVSKLVFSSQFSVTDVGGYRCELVNEGELVDSQLVELFQATPTATSSAADCEKVTEKLVLFQIRVATISCPTWNQATKSAISEETQNILFRILSTQCEECDVAKEMLTVVSLECSSFIEGGAVFRGSIETGSASQTEMLSCALARWQGSGPLLSVDGERFLVDSSCRLQIGSYSEEECVESESEGQMDVSMVLIISVPVGGVVLLIAIIFIIVICSFCCRHCRGEMKISDGTGPYEVNTLGYFRSTGDPRFQHPTMTDAVTSRHSLVSITRQQENPFYNDTVHFDAPRYQPQQQPASPVYDEAISPDRRPLFGGPPESLPREPDMNFNDSGVSLNMGSAAPPPGSGSPPSSARVEPSGTVAQPYQVPTASSGSLNKVGVANPMWQPGDSAHQQGGRRFSEGPSLRSPKRLSGSGCTSCVTIQDRESARPIGQLSTRDQSTGITASSEDYSHLDFSLPSHSVTSLGTGPQRKWYMSSEGSYSSLNEMPTRTYERIPNSQFKVSPARFPYPKDPPTMNAHRGSLPMTAQQGLKIGRVPSAPIAESVPSLMNKQQVQTSLV